MAQMDTDTALFDESEMGNGGDAGDSSSDGGEATDMGGKAVKVEVDGAGDGDNEDAVPAQSGVGIPNADESTVTGPNSSEVSEPNDAETAGLPGTAGDNNIDDDAGNEVNEASANGVDEQALQSFADQLASLDDPAMMAMVRGLPDESRQTLCSAVAGTLSDEQLSQCGLSKADAMGLGHDGDGDGDEAGARDPKGSNDRLNDNGNDTANGTASDDSALQISMAKAKPEQMPGSTYMSMTGTATSNDKTIALELAQMKGEKLINRAKAVHAKNPQVITSEQIEQTEALLQGEKCLSLLKADAGDLQPILTLVAMGERMVNGENALLEVKTLNMSLTGAAGGDGARAVDLKSKDTRGYDDAEAQKAADERWSTGKSGARTTPAMIG